MNHFNNRSNYSSVTDYTHQVFVFFMGLLFASVVNAANGHILSDQEASAASEVTLNAEVTVFQTIGMGIALSIARCKNQFSCDPPVKDSELERLIETLDSRVNTLTIRQQQSGEDFSELRTEYINQQQAFLRYQADLNNFTAGLVEEPDDIEPDSFAEDISEEAAPVDEEQIDFSVFEDFDEELQ